MSTSVTATLPIITLPREGGRASARPAPAPVPPVKNGPAAVAATPVPVQEPKPAPEPAMRETLEAVAHHIQEFLDANGRSLTFSVDESSGDMVISVRSSATGELIRQIPNAEALSVLQRLSADSGTLLDTSV